MERSSREDEQTLKSYYTHLKAEGLPFDGSTSRRYAPLPKEAFTRLYEFAVKTKQSRLMQVADLFLWPMCQGGYDQTHRAYRSLIESGQLIDTRLRPEEKAERGIKYSCFDTVSHST